MRIRPALQPIASFFCTSLAISSLLLLTSCGGGGSSSSSVATTPPPSSTITSVSVSCAINTVPVGQTNQCGAKVQGTGSFSQTVSWSVGGVPGGNSSLGTITSSGLYTAPNTVPTPYTVNVSATSAQDGTKSSFASVVVAGTIASATQTVTAATGGTITLPDGSSVTIPANVLTADQSVTVSKLSAPQNPPPSGSVVNAGPLLNLSLSVPMPQVTMPLRLRSLRNQSSQPDASDIQFSIMIGSDANSTLQGSAPMVDLITSSGEQNIFFPTGTYDQANQTAQIYLDSGYLSGVEEMNASMANFDSTIPVLAPSVTSWELYWVAGQGFQKLPQVASGACPLLSSLQNANILMLVHGMGSTVEDSFTNSASAIQAAGGYSLVLGFDYDSTQRVATSGQELADFVGSLANCEGIQRIDIEAHSEGVVVSINAGSLLKGSAVVGLMKNFVSVAGPIKGTPLADAPAAFAAYLWSALSFGQPSWLPSSLGGNLASAIQGLTVLGDLTSTNDPQSKVRSNFATVLPNIQFVAVGGESCPPAFAFLVSSNFAGHPYDCAVPLDSALSFASGIVSYPLPPFPPFEQQNDDHWQLVGDPTVIAEVGKQVQQNSPPALTCEASEKACDGTQAEALPFLFLLSNRSLDSSDLDVFIQDSTGNVTPLSPAFSYADGGISWSLMPSCPNPPCDFSIFSFDSTDTLASNNVMATVESGSGTAGITFNPTALNVGNVQTGSSATQSVTLTNTGTATLQIAQIDLTNNAGAFSLNNLCPTSLTVGANCTVSITFTPTQPGAQSATLSVTDNAAGSPQGVSLTGTGTSSVPVLSTFTISPNTITSGQSATLSLGLSGTTSSTATISLSSNNSSAFPVPPTVNIPAGQSSTSLSDAAGTVSSTTTVTVTAAYNGVSLQAQVTVNPATQTPVLTTFTISPNTISSGQSATLSLGLSGTTNSTATISLSSSNSSAFPVPPTVNIQAGQSSTSFSDEAGTVTTTTTVTVTATYNGTSLQAQVTVNPISPTVNNVAPNPVIASNSDQPIGIFGSNFQNGDTLTFIDTLGQPHQSVPSKLTFVSSSQIDYEFNDNSDIGTWTVTVNSADNSEHSLPFSFLVAEFTIGENVMVSGTGGAGLNLRACAALSCTSLVDMPDGTVMGVIGGPTAADGHTWWELSGLVGGTSYTGWAVQDFLVPD